MNNNGIILLLIYWINESRFIFLRVILEYSSNDVLGGLYFWYCYSIYLIK